MRVQFLFFLFFVSTPVLGQAERLEFAQPFFLTTYSEIFDLPVTDQKKYIEGLRRLAKELPTDILGSIDTSECKDDQRLCEPSLFGSKVCVPTTQLGFDECSRRMEDAEMKTFFREPSSENTWKSFEHRIQSYCGNALNMDRCRKLEELRIQTFMNRRSH